MSIKCTIVSKTDVDPDYAAAYTKNGFEVVFRPDASNYSNDKSQHPKARSFFPNDKPSQSSEHTMKSQAAKWECVRKAENRFEGSKLFNPVFDISSHHRNRGQDENDKQPIEFVCVITIKSGEVRDLYSEVVRKYKNILNPLTPQQTVQINI